MSRITIDSHIIRELGHSGLKTLQSLTDLLEIYDIDKVGGLHDPQLRKIFHRSVQSLTQAIRDVRLLAICEETEPRSQSPINWKSMVENSLSGRYSTAVSLTGDNANYDGNGFTELINSAVANIGWFAKQFWNHPIRVRLSTESKDGHSWVLLKWEFGNSVVVTPDFSAFMPYYPMFPEKSLALGDSTGLALCVSKRIAELHGGSLSATNVSGNLVMEWRCQKSGV